MQVQTKTTDQVSVIGQDTMYRVLFALGFCHMLNDSIQAVIPAIFPILQQSMNLTFFQLGLIGFTLNMTASVLQPVVGLYTDKKPSPYLLPLGMLCTLLGMLGLAFAPNLISVLLSVLLVGFGSAVFHPEGSRVANMAAGSRRGLAQSIYQVGGNSGQSLAPIMTALIFVPLGQFGAIWFTVVAAIAMVILLYVASWSKSRLTLANNLVTQGKKKEQSPVKKMSAERKKRVVYALILLVFLVFARSWYHAGITNFYPFYIIDQYGLTVSEAQIYIFLFLAAGALGTFLGGPLADRFGKKTIICFSMLGPAPLALLLPHVSQFWVYPIVLINGFILLSSFSVAVIYAQDVLPGRIGMVSGLIIGLAFGMGAIGSVALGGLVDLFGLKTIMVGCGCLPLLGILSFLLPSDQKLKELEA